MDLKIFYYKLFKRLIFIDNIYLISVYVVKTVMTTRHGNHLLYTHTVKAHFKDPYLCILAVTIIFYPLNRFSMIQKLLRYLTKTSKYLA